jgi:transposase
VQALSSRSVLRTLCYGTTQCSTDDLTASIADPRRVECLMTISGIRVTAVFGLLAAIGDISRFASSEKLVSYLGLNPSVRQ